MQASWPQPTQFLVAPVQTTQRLQSTHPQAFHAIAAAIAALVAITLIAGVRAAALAVRRAWASQGAGDDAYDGQQGLVAGVKRLAVRALQALLKTLGVDAEADRAKLRERERQVQDLRQAAVDHTDELMSSRAVRAQNLACLYLSMCPQEERCTTNVRV